LERYKHNLIFWLSYYTFKHLPIRIITIKKTYNENNKMQDILMCLNTYKVDFNHNINADFTYIPNEKLCYFKPNNEKYPHFNYKPNEIGICDNDKMKFLIPDEKHGFKMNKINFLRCESDRIINNVSFRKMKNLDEEEIYLKQKNLLIQEAQKVIFEKEKKYLELKAPHFKQNIFSYKFCNLLYIYFQNLYNKQDFSFFLKSFF